MKKFFETVGQIVVGVTAGQLAAKGIEKVAKKIEKVVEAKKAGA